MSQSQKALLEKLEQLERETTFSLSHKDPEKYKKNMKKINKHQKQLLRTMRTIR